MADLKLKKTTTVTTRTVYEIEAGELRDYIATALKLNLPDGVGVKGRFAIRFLKEDRQGYLDAVDISRVEVEVLDEKKS